MGTMPSTTGSAAIASHSRGPTSMPLPTITASCAAPATPKSTLTTNTKTPGG